MEQSLFKKHSKSQNFDEIFYSGMIRLRNINFDVFIRCQYTRTISKKKNMVQGLFKKNSKLLILDEYFTVALPTRLRNTVLNYCGFCRYGKIINPNKLVTQLLFKNHLKFRNFNIQ